MSTIREQVAYLQGLAEGMKIDSSDEGKLFSAIIDVLDVMADEIEELTENALDIGEELDALSDDLAEVEDFLEENCLEDDGFDFDGFDEDNDDWDNFDDDDWDDDEGRCCDICGNSDFTLDVNCPECNAELEIDENDIAREAVTCHACGKDIELQINEVDADDVPDNATVSVAADASAYPTDTSPAPATGTPEQFLRTGEGMGHDV